MASLIFRPYWINGEKKFIGVIGDISLDVEFRGKGIAKEFILFINCYLKENSFLFSFVIPNIPAQKTLSSAGWKTQEKLVRHVFMLNPHEKLFSILKSRVLSNIIAVIYRAFIGSKILRNAKNYYKMEFVEAFDSSFDSLWDSIKKEGVILSDRSSATLTWRYMKHPNDKFKAVKFMDGNKLAAYLIYLFKEDQKICIIYNALSYKDSNLKYIIWLFLKYLKKETNVLMVNTTINEKHKYSLVLNEIGFSKRKGGNIFQVLNTMPTEDIVSNNWYITLGDKDV